MKVFAATSKGPHKIENEDRIVINRTILSEGSYYEDFDSGLIAIADGVGGNNAGSVASHFVVNKISELEIITQAALMRINEDLLKLSKTSESLSGMATTLSGLTINSESINAFHVGNTRIYILIADKYLNQVTVDDTIVNYLLKSGQITQNDFAFHQLKNEITACFGGGSLSLLKLSFIPNLGFGTFLLTTDGVHDFLTDDEIETILVSYNDNYPEACSVLIGLARANGSMDDASVVVVG
jgi:protein phosphatase